MPSNWKLLSACLNSVNYLTGFTLYFYINVPKHWMPTKILVTAFSSYMSSQNSVFNYRPVTAFFPLNAGSMAFKSVLYIISYGWNIQEKMHPTWVVFRQNLEMLGNNPSVLANRDWLIKNRYINARWFKAACNQLKKRSKMLQ